MEPVYNWVMRHGIHADECIPYSLPVSRNCTKQSNCTLYKDFLNSYIAIRRYRDNVFQLHWTGNDSARLPPFEKWRSKEFRLRCISSVNYHLMKACPQQTTSGHVHATGPLLQRPHHRLHRRLLGFSLLRKGSNLQTRHGFFQGVFLSICLLQSRLLYEFHKTGFGMFRENRVLTGEKSVVAHVVAATGYGQGEQGEKYWLVWQRLCRECFYKNL